MKSVYIVDACRTAVGKYGGSLAGVRPDDMLAEIIRGILQRNPGIPQEEIEEVISGAANQSGEDNRNVARMAALLAGLPISVAGITVNRLCASGLQAIIDGNRAIACGEADLILAGGVESMTRAPFVMAKSETPFGRLPEFFDTTFGWRFTNPALSALYHPFVMGETAENLAEKYQITREEQDEFAFKTQTKWKQANDSGKFKDEIHPYAIPPSKKGGDIKIFDTDEHPRLSPLEQLAQLKPAFKKNGSVTAGNASGLNDGAAMTLLASEETVKRLQLKPIARIVASAVAGVDPAIMGIGPVPATEKALKRAGLQLQDIDLIELNEAFAAQVIACNKALPFNPDILNVNGGAIAIGHPLGCSGARITATLVHELKRRSQARYGLATMCVGVGQGVAMIVEKV
jgi:acetyl-CoA C-acetyltransferase